VVVAAGAAVVVVVGAGAAVVVVVDSTGAVVVVDGTGAVLVDVVVSVDTVAAAVWVAEALEASAITIEPPPRKDNRLAAASP
jgi:hypothetical protein